MVVPIQLVVGLMSIFQPLKVCTILIKMGNQDRGILILIYIYTYIQLHLPESTNLYCILYSVYL